MTFEEKPPQPLSELNRLDQLCDRFERAWKEGSSPRIEDYLAEVAEAERAALLRELLCLEVDYRRQRGEQLAADEYLTRFPQLDRAALEAELAAGPSPRPSDPLAATVQPTPSGSAAASAPGVRIRYLGDYELLEEIAHGAMGVVYKARQISLNRIVAVKMILAGQLATQADHDRFHSEAQAAALLDHPNIVPVFEVGEHEGQHYFSMGYVDGTSLSARLTDGPLPPREAAEIVATVAEAVEYAHRQGVIHRDIKPSNILIDSQGRPRVTDFGLAKRLDSGSNLTATGDVLGTPSYMAPEQAAGQIGAVGPAVDIYGLGALLYASLTGRPPFQAATPFETMQQVIEQEPVPVRQLNAAVPHDLETISLKCLEKSVPRRYPCVRALAEDLWRYLEDRPILARPVGRIEHAWRWCKRQPVVAGLTATVAISLAAGIVVSSLFAADAYRLARRAQENEQQANVNLHRAEAAEAVARHDLAKALTAQAQLSIRSHQPGQQFDALEAIAKVTQIEGPSRKLADDAVSALCLADMVVAKQWPVLHNGPGHVAFSPRLDTYARCGADGKLGVRRVADNAEIAAFQLDRDVDDLDGLEFSPDGRYLRAATGSDDIGIFERAIWKCWLFRVDAEPGAIALKGRPLALALSPDGRHYVARYRSGEDWPDSQQHVSDIFSICELSSGKELERFAVPAHRDDLNFMFWNPRKRQIVLYRRAGWRILDLDSRACEPECLVNAEVGYVTWHPDGRHLAVASAYESPPRVHIYDAITRRVVANDCVGSPALGLRSTLNQAGNLLMTTDGSGVRRLWDPASGVELLRLHSMDCNLDNNFCIGTDDRFAAPTIDGENLQVHRISRGAERVFAPPTASHGYYGDIAPSPDGRILAISSGAGVSLVDSQTGFELAIIPDRQPIRFTENGSLLTVGTNGFNCWRAQSQLEMAEVVVYVRDPLGSKQMGVDPRGQVRWSASQDGTVVVMGTKQGALVMRLKSGGKFLQVVDGPGYTVQNTAVSPDGKWVATATLKTPLRTLANGPVSEHVRIWDAVTGKLLRSLPVGQDASVWVSPGGHWLATHSLKDDEIRLWRCGSWDAGARFPAVGSVAFSPDEHIAAIAGKADKIQLCDVQTGREFAVLPIVNGMIGTIGTPLLCFSPDGTRLYGKVEWQKGEYRVWDLRQIRDGLRKLGLDQGWPDFPPRQPGADAPPPIVKDAGEYFLDLARIQARKGDQCVEPTEKQKQRDEAIQYLCRAIDNGYNDLAHIVNDQELPGIRKHPGFLEKVKPLIAGNVDALVALGLYQDAGVLLERRRSQADSDPLVWLRCAALLLKRGDRDGYQALREDLLRRWGEMSPKDAKPGDAEKVVKACLLLPLEGKNMEKLVELANSAVEHSATPFPLHSCRATLGLALYRNGDFYKAHETLRSWNSGDPTAPMSLAVSAMALHRLNREQGVMPSVRLAKELMQPDVETTIRHDWHDWFVAEILCREAEELIAKGQKPSTQPRDDVEAANAAKGQQTPELKPEKDSSK